jgi:hypothetical protein
LGLQQLDSHIVDADAVVFPGYGCQQRDDLDFFAIYQRVKCKYAVLVFTLRHDDRLLVHLRLIEK